MEKVIYTLSRRDFDTPNEFASILINELGPGLITCGALRVTLAVNDAGVAQAEPLRIVYRQPRIDAVIGTWVHSANDRGAVEAMLAGHCSSIAGYLVSESEPLRNPASTRNGERTPGMMQIALLQVPIGLNHDEWFSVWRDDHTGVAIDTQSTFIYRQNLVVRPVTPAAPTCAAIVEEAFPAAAMTSQHAFYDAVGDDDKLERNRAALWASSKRFVDVTTIEVIPTSEFVFGSRLD